MNSASVIESEQRYIDRAYEALAKMRTDAGKIASGVLPESGGGTHQARYERDVFVQLALERIHKLNLGSHPLVFGRMDTTDDETFYLGRVAVSDTDRTALVVDWRAPVAAAFYRATALEPLDLILRRHLFCDGPKLLDYADERFDDPDDLGLAGPGALVAALDAPRTGFMKDIVTTIQREQDEIIRAPLRGVLVVQGGPGTGKTAVALHRAAYLLFTHRRTIGNRGILIVGPNAVFMRYIDRVLPALGESDSALSTIDGLVERYRATAVDTREVAAIKADRRMATLIRRFLKALQRPLTSTVEVPFGPIGLPLTPSDSQKVIATARRIPGTHNARRRNVVKFTLQRLHQRYENISSRLEESPLRGLELDEFAMELAGEEAIHDAIERMWPVLTPADLIADMFDSEPLLRRCGRGLFSDRELGLLLRPAPDDLREIDWTRSDLALLDEAAWLLGDRNPSAEQPTYGHVVVDEAQDMTPMQLRMLARRSGTGSLTLVGDLAQATGASSPEGWDDILEHLPTTKGVQHASLTVSYRTPGGILRYANRVLQRIAPNLSQPEPVRDTGEFPRIERVDDPAQRAAEIAKTHSSGTMAVVVPRSILGETESALKDAGIVFGRAEIDGLSETITVVGVDVVKGLEFDAVVVLEPKLIEADHGPRALYVALTRSTQTLWVLHAGGIQAELASV